MNRPASELKNKNRVQFTTADDGKRFFREYWIHEWDAKGYDAHEHIKDVDMAIKRARELGYEEDAKDMERTFKGSKI